MRRHRREIHVLSEINLTNLVDTSFVLLIAFMLMAPAVRHGMGLELPQVPTAGTLEGQESKSVTIIIKPFDGGSDRIYFSMPGEQNEEMVALNELADRVKTAQVRYPKLDIVLQVDRNSKAETMLAAISALKAAGIDNVGIPTEPLATPKPGAK